MPAALRYPLRTSLFMLLTASALACGGDDGPDDDGGGGGGGGLDNVPAGASQLSAADRAAVSTRLQALALTVGTDDPDASLAIGAIAQAVVAEGWITGVDLEAGASLVGGDSRLKSLQATERWGIFVGDVAVLESGSPPTGTFIRGIVALRGTRTAVGYMVGALDAGQPFNGVFTPTSSARGLIFEGTSAVWIATGGGISLTTALQLYEGCGGQIPAGVECINARYNGAVSISSSVPLAVGGNTASGSRSLAFGTTSLRGYQISVFCEQSSLC